MVGQDGENRVHVCAAWHEFVLGGYQVLKYLVHVVDTILRVICMQRILLKFHWLHRRHVLCLVAHAWASTYACVQLPGARSATSLSSQGAGHIWTHLGGPTGAARCRRRNLPPARAP